MTTSMEPPKLAAPKETAPFPRAKIRKAVAKIIPKDQTFLLQVEDSGIRHMKIVRIITWAWKTLRPADRIVKVLDAMVGQLTPKEEKRILRYSVLTPEELKNVSKW